MANPYGSLLIAILIASSACLAVESTQSQPSIATITGEIRDPTSREITFGYLPPSGLGIDGQRVVLDSQNRFAFELPVVRGTVVWVWGNQEGDQWKWVRWLEAFLFGYNPLVFFVEPGDSLHVTVQEGFFGPSYSFSGPNADNNRFFAEWYPRLESFHLDYKGLEVEDFKRQIDQRRRDQAAFLAEGREQYALSPGCIDYVTAYSNYEWTIKMVAYPRMYRGVNGHENKDIPPEYYDFLQEISLVDEKAIGVENYRAFLLHTLRKLGEESAAVQAQLDSISTETHTRKKRNFAEEYDFAKQKLEGRVLYWYLATDLIHAFKRGSSETVAAAQRKWEDFQESNPYPEYTEAVQTALSKARKLQIGQPAPAFTLDDLDGQSVSLNQFKGQVVLLDFWASWCGPCIGDLPDLRKIKERTAGQSVVFLNLSLDDDEAAWRKAVDKHEIKGVHVRAAGMGSDVARSYNIDALPSYYLVDSQGFLVERLSGVRDTDAIVAMIEKSL